MHKLYENIYANKYSPAGATVFDGMASVDFGNTYMNHAYLKKTYDETSAASNIRNNNQEIMMLLYYLMTSLFSKMFWYPMFLNDVAARIFIE